MMNSDRHLGPDLPLDAEILPRRPNAAPGVAVRLCWRDGRVSIGDFDEGTTLICCPGKDGGHHVFTPTGLTDAAGRLVFFEEPAS